MSPLRIQTTGLEQFAPGGNMRLRVVVLGGGGAGKTRWSSFSPRPFYANCEAGLGSVADRKVPYADVSSSQDMLDVLEYMRQECMKPWDQRRYHTLVIDTVDAYQRKLKDEWLRSNPGAQAFSGFDAWGFLNTRMQQFLTRLLNLDMHILVLAHYKEKSIKEGTGELATERQELRIRLQGESGDTIFDDYDLVGWMGTYYEAVDGQRVQKRGLTFRETPERPFLKDRLDMTPPWIEVTFAESDYEALFTRLRERIAKLEASEELGEIPHAASTFLPGPDVPIMVPGSGGALPPMEAREAPLESRGKNELVVMAREMQLPGIKGNTLKSELIDMINAAGGVDAWFTAKTAAAETVKPEPVQSEPEPEPKPESEAAPMPEEPVAEPIAEDVPTEAEVVAAAAIPECGKAYGPQRCTYDATHPGNCSWASPMTDAGEPVNEVTGEIQSKPDVEMEAAVAAVVETTGATVIPEPTAPPKAAAPAPAAPRPAIGGVERPADCTECGNSIDTDPPLELTGGRPIMPVQKESYIRVSYIKARRYMCAGCFLTLNQVKR